MVSSVSLSSSNSKGQRGKGNRWPKGRESQYEFFWIWTCCICWGQAEMNTWACPGCSHPRCEACPQEFLKLPAGRGSHIKLSTVFGTPFNPDSKYITDQDAMSILDSIESVDVMPETVTDQSKDLNYTSSSVILDQVAPTFTLDVENNGPPTVSSHLIPLSIPTSEDEPIFIPRPIDDSVFLELWHNTVLVAVTSNPSNFEELKSMHLLRQGPSEEESVLTIFISIDTEDENIKNSLREKISAFFDETSRPKLRISFEKCSIRRTSGNSLPPICEARNTGYHRYPACGASIGIRHRVDQTATLGGYLIVDGRPHALTVDHIVPTDWKDQLSIDITHPSEQESQFKPLWLEVKTFLQRLEICCPFCFTLWQQHCQDNDFYKSVECLELGKHCATALEFQALKDELLRRYPCPTLGKLVSRSKTRSRIAEENEGPFQVEMDWALIDLEEWPIQLDSHIKQISKSLEFSKIKPGRHVKATGRTSGLQSGQINMARSIIRHESRFTQEWTVIRNSQSSLEEWISGGIGVDGDSGAWIIDRDSGDLYGMVWGRDRLKSPICLFSPIFDIIADMKEQIGATTVSLPREEAPVTTEDKEEQTISNPSMPQVIPHNISIDRFSVRQNSFPEMIGATSSR